MGEPAAEAVPSTLTVSVDVGDTEAEARGVPEEEGDPEKRGQGDRRRRVLNLLKK